MTPDSEEFVKSTFVVTLNAFLWVIGDDVLFGKN